MKGIKLNRLLFPVMILLLWNESLDEIYFWDHHNSSPLRWLQNMCTLEKMNWTLNFWGDGALSLPPRFGTICTHLVPAVMEPIACSQALAPSIYTRCYTCQKTGRALPVHHSSVSCWTLQETLLLLETRVDFLEEVF